MQSFQPQTELLIVDDDPSTAQLLWDTLTGAGFSCNVARDGVEAITVARAQLPGLVLLDLDLPEMSGIEICRLLRAGADTAGVRILVLTALPVGEAEAALAAGADDYMTKPFTLQGLLEKVRRLLATDSYVARERGVTEVHLAQVADPGHSALPERERLTLQFVELLVTQPAAITDSFYEEMRRHFSEVQLVEVMFFALAYNSLYRFNSALERGGEPKLKVESVRVYYEAAARLEGNGALDRWVGGRVSGATVAVLRKQVATTSTTDAATVHSFAQRLWQ